MQHEKLRVYNAKPRLVVGPSLAVDGLGTVSYRFPPGETLVPTAYVKACYEHTRTRDGSPGPGRKLFAEGGALRVLTGQATPAPAVAVQPSKPVPLPTSLEGFSLHECMAFIGQIGEADADKLIDWGQSDDREEVQHACLLRLRSLGFQG